MLKQKSVQISLLIIAIIFCTTLALGAAITKTAIDERRLATEAWMATMIHLAGTASFDEIQIYNAEQALLVTPGTPTPTSLYDAYIEFADQTLQDNGY
jgi:hypothetical protein